MAIILLQETKFQARIQYTLGGVKTGMARQEIKHNSMVFIKLNKI